MTPLAWLIGLVLPACAATGAQGVAVPPPLDLARIERPSSANEVLAASEASGARPDIVTPDYPVPAARLFAAINHVAATWPRTYALARDEPGLQSSWVVRSAVFNFPDIVSVRVAPHGDAASTLAIYSHSVYGRSDLGVNRERVRAWLAALDATLPPQAKSPQAESSQAKPQPER